MGLATSLSNKQVCKTPPFPIQAKENGGRLLAIVLIGTEIWADFSHHLVISSEQQGFNGGGCSFQEPCKFNFPHHWPTGWNLPLLMVPKVDGPQKSFVISTARKTQMGAIPLHTLTVWLKTEENPGEGPLPPTPFKHPCLLPSPPPMVGKLQWHLGGIQPHGQHFFSMGLGRDWDWVAGAPWLHRPQNNILLSNKETQLEKQNETEG